jgi:ParB family chromosome partitioning protein
MTFLLLSSLLFFVFLSSDFIFQQNKTKSISTLLQIFLLNFLKMLGKGVKTMPKFRTKKEWVRFLPVEQIYPSPWSARRSFGQEEMESLAKSIAQYGMLTPITVQEKCGEYEILSGERRLRAAKMLEMRRVPCRIVQVTARAGAEFAVLENIQRSAISPFEEAAALDRLLKNFRYTQTELAERLGISQSALNHKLRLLRFSAEERDLIEKNHLSLPKARSLLHLRDPAMRLFAMHYTIEHDLTEKQCEELCQTLEKKPEEFSPALRAERTERESPVRRLVVKDVRVFINSVDRAILSIREAGFTVEAEKADDDAYISYSIRVPKYSKA